MSKTLSPTEADMNDQDFWYDLDFSIVGFPEQTVFETTFFYIWHYHAGYGDDLCVCATFVTEHTGAEIVVALAYDQGLL